MCPETVTPPEVGRRRGDGRRGFGGGFLGRPGSGRMVLRLPRCDQRHQRCGLRPDARLHAVPGRFFVRSLERQQSLDRVGPGISIRRGRARGTRRGRSSAATTVHPNDSDPWSPEHAVVRRWVSDVSGAHTRHRGASTTSIPPATGTTGRVYHDGGADLFRRSAMATRQNVNVAVNLSVGDRLDFVVDTGPADADGSDGTNTSFQGRARAAGVGTAVSIPITAEGREHAQPRWPR